MPIALHPLHAILLAFPVALFPGALLADITYLNSSEMQWSNFASWLIAGALVFTGLALSWAVIGMLARRVERESVGRGWFSAILALLFVVGLVNAFQHSHDGWSSVGMTGLALSVISAVLALAAGWIGYTVSREVRA